MKTTPFKIASLSVIAVALTAGTALAGGGENCDKKKHSAMKTEATANQTTMRATPEAVVLSAAEEKKTMAKAKHKKMTYSFDDAVKVCQEKGVADIQACVDYKTGKTSVKPQS